MSYKRKYATKEELSAALSRAARSRKNNHNCGRKRKITDDGMRFTCIAVRRMDRDVLYAISKHDGKSTADLIHDVAASLRGYRDDIFPKGCDNELDAAKPEPQEVV